MAYDEAAVDDLRRDRKLILLLFPPAGLQTGTGYMSAYLGGGVGGRTPQACSRRLCSSAHATLVYIICMIPFPLAISTNPLPNAR